MKNQHTLKRQFLGVSARVTLSEKKKEGRKNQIKKGSNILAGEKREG